MNIACPSTVRGDRMPRSCANCTGERPWRSTITRNSLTLCAQCTVSGMSRASAAAWLSRSRSVVQVSICAGETMPDSRPDGCAAACLDQRQRRIEAAPPGGLVPAVLQRPAILELPARRGVGRCQEHAQPALRRNLDPALVDAGQVGDAGDAGQQHLAERHLLAGLARHRIRLQRDRALVEPAHVHGGDAVLLAHAAIERLGARMRVQVDQPWHHHQVGPVDRRINSTVVMPAHEAERVAGEGDVTAHQISVPPVCRIPGDDAGGVADAGRGWHDVLPMR